MAVKAFGINALRKYGFNGTADLDTSTVKLALVTSAQTSGYSAWAVATAYSVGDFRRPTTRNGRRYKCTVAGTSHASTEPTWPTTAGATVVDGTVTWTEYGGDLADKTIWGNVSANEVASGNGYTTGGKTLAGIVLDDDKFDADNPVWTALGNPSAVSFLYAFLYLSGTLNGVVDPLLMYYLLDDSMTQITVTNSDYTIQFPTAGIITFPYP
jgi:hypothetical protein